MRIMAYELKKLLSFKAFLFIIVSCIVIGAVSSVISISSVDHYPGDYERIISDIRDLSDSEKAEYLNSQLDAQMEENGTALYSSQSIYTLLEQIERNNGYSAYLDSIKERCQSITGISLFADKGSFLYKNAQKISSAYDNIKNTSLPLDVSQGVENILINNISDILIIFSMFASVIFVFIKDKESGIMNLLYSYPKGRTKLCISKIKVLFLFSFMLVLLFMGELFIINMVIYGLGDLSRPIQSVNGFFECSFNFTVWQYLLITFIFKSFGVFVFGLIFAIICTFSKNSAQIYCISGLISGSELLLYLKISKISNLGLIHDFNIVSFIKPENIFSTYRNLNIFGIPVNIVIADMVVYLILLVFLFFYITKIFSNAKNQEYKKIIIYKRRKNSKKIHGRMYYAFYKSLVLQKSFAFICIWIAFTVIYHLGFSKPITTVDYYYEKYTTENSGLITECTDKIITENEIYFNDLENKSKSGKLTRSEFYQYQSVEDKKRAFDHFKSKVEKIRNSSDNEIFYDSGYERAFGIYSNKETMQMMLIIILLCVLCISPLISYDKEINFNNIIYSMTTGKKQYIKRNIVITAVYSIFASYAVMIPYFINILNKYGTQGILSPVRSIETFATSPLPLSIWQYALVLLIFRTLIIVISGLIMLMISYKSNSRFSAVLINSTIFVIPLIILNLLNVN